MGVLQHSGVRKIQVFRYQKSIQISIRSNIQICIQINSLIFRSIAFKCRVLLTSRACLFPIVKGRHSGHARRLPQRTTDRLRTPECCSSRIWSTIFLLSCRLFLSFKLCLCLRIKPQLVDNAPQLKLCSATSAMASPDRVRADSGSEPLRSVPSKGGIYTFRNVT